MKLCLATPAYGGHVHVHYMQSVLGLQKVLASEIVDFEFFTIHFDSLIPRARNVCHALSSIRLYAHDLYRRRHRVQPASRRSMRERPRVRYIRKKKKDFDKVEMMAPKADNMKELVEHCS